MLKVHTMTMREAYDVKYLNSPLEFWSSLVTGLLIFTTENLPQLPCIKELTLIFSICSHIVDMTFQDLLLFPDMASEPELGRDRAWQEEVS